MRIGIDIDNTLVKTEIKASELYKKIYNEDFFALPKISQYRFCGENKETIYEADFFENSIDVLKRLKQKHEIYFITARSNKNVLKMEEKTIDMLKENGIIYDGICFGNDSKIKAYKELKIDIMIDDDYDVYTEIINDGKKAILFEGNLNKGKEGLKFNNWLDIEKYIERM
jgi:uncharacterized HAD superfamily protein